MRLLRVRESDQDWLATQPESAMGVQFVILKTAAGTQLVQVVGGRVIFERTADTREAPPLESWMIEGNPQERATAFETWLAGLPLSQLSLSQGSVSGGRFIINPGGPFPGMPVPPPVVFGHLPFTGTRGSEVYYRWEPFPTSRRIDQTTFIVAPGTFTAPASEVAFVASGFGAVGRFALPNLNPANWRWELRPPAGTAFRCGASVPLYGQSGGGVEVEFTSGFQNVGPIANPVVLPAL